MKLHEGPVPTGTRRTPQERADICATSIESYSTFLGETSPADLEAGLRLSIACRLRKARARISRFIHEMER